MLHDSDILELQVNSVVNLLAIEVEVFLYIQGLQCESSFVYQWFAVHQSIPNQGVGQVREQNFRFRKYR